MPTSEERINFIESEMEECKSVDTIMGIACLLGIAGIVAWNFFSKKDDGKKITLLGKNDGR